LFVCKHKESWGKILELQSVVREKDQTSDFDGFIVRDSRVNSKNQAPHGNIDDDHEN
jgi:hypothetical protein